MKILIIFAHPSKESFNRAVLKACADGADAAGHETKVLDLYADGFNPVLSAEALKGQLSSETLRHQDLIRWADWMVFIFPVWWFRAPAILEGWFDKTFTPRFAYRFKPITKTFGVPVGLLPCKKAVVIESYGSPGWAMRLIYFSLVWRRLRRGLLKYCGIQKLIHLPFYSAPYSSAAAREAFLNKVRRLPSRLK